MSALPCKRDFGAFSQRPKHSNHKLWLEHVHLWEHCELKDWKRHQCLFLRENFLFKNPKQNIKNWGVRFLLDAADSFILSLYESRLCSVLLPSFRFY